ncbi:MAG: ABC transporter permease [Chloroflexi bacterium]|nr:ABC transporter permease [Chloroflexota bacterium]
MSILFRIGAIFVVAVKRLFAQRRLAFLTAVGLTVAVAITLSVPLYADAVYGRTLSGTLSEGAQASNARPPFAFMYRQIASSGKPARWENVLAANSYLTGQAIADLGLPAKQVVRFLKTDFLELFPSDISSGYLTIRNQLGYAGIGTVTDFADHVTIKEGHFPAAATGRLSDPIEVLVSDELATKIGFQVGETYLMFNNRMGPNGTPVQFPVRVAGVWSAKDEQEDYWFYKPWALSEVLLVPEETFTSQIVPALKDPIYVALWYLVLDGSDLRPRDAAPLLSRMDAVTQGATQLLPGIRLEYSPAKALVNYETAASLLTILLFAFSIPIIGMILAFITLVVGLTVGQQRNEIAVLRSRGGTMFQVVGIAALEALALNAVALALGWPLSEVFAQTIGRTRSFLDLGPATDLLHVRMSLDTLRFGLAMAAVALVTQLIPTLGAARHTIITYKQERARTLRPPWWQRAWLDLLLLIPTGYGIYMLRKQGSIIGLPIIGDTLPNDPFQNPLLFLIPSLGVFALTLVILRLLPLVMRAVTWVVSHTRSVGLLLATRHLARSPGYYAAPLLLLVLTLSLSAFTASLATTLDDHLWDQSYYKVGADMRLDELGQGVPADAYTGTSAGAPATSGTPKEGPLWLFLPISEHLKVPGIQAAARVGRFSVAALLPKGGAVGTFYGVDRVDFARVAFWRRDFAPSSLGALMNALASAPDGVLVSRATMAEHALRVGDTLRIETSAYRTNVEVPFKIVGELDLFPTWYPEDGPLLVGNLDYFFEQVGGEVPYSVWVTTGSNQDYEGIAKGVQELGLNVIKWEAPLRSIAAEQRRPERQGLFGLLSVGFLTAALLTVLGFLLYALFSFRRRTIELGILRAVGLSAGQMTAFLAWELIFLILTGLAAGTGLGAWISNLFIPYLQVGTGAAARIPPFLVEIAWPAIFRIYAVFGLLFVVALVVLAVLLLRMKIYQAIKLGETV